MSIGNQQQNRQLIKQLLVTVKLIRIASQDFFGALYLDQDYGTGRRLYRGNLSPREIVIAEAYLFKRLPYTRQSPIDELRQMSQQGQV
jgi:hypothetical protein